MKNFILLFLFIISSNILLAQTRIFPFKKNNTWGVIDENLKVIKEPTFEKLKFFINHDSLNALSYAALNSRAGLIDRDGNIVIPFDYDHIRVWKNITAASLRIDNKVGVFDLKKGKISIPVLYKLIIPYANEKYLLVKKDDNYGISDISHRLIVPVKYSFVEVMEQKDGSVKFKANLDNLIKVYNENGKVIKSYTKKEKTTKEDGLFFADMDIDEDNDFVPIPPIYLDSNKLGDEIGLYRTLKDDMTGDRFGIVHKDRFYGLIDEESNLLTPIEYRKIIRRHKIPGILLQGQDRLYGWFSMIKKKVMLPTEYKKIEASNRFSSLNNRDKKVENYLFLNTTEKDGGGFFELKTGKVFLPKK